MEMELQYQTLEGYRLLLDTALAQEETSESIVPDALPDVARIICAAGHAYLRGREAGAGTVRLSGSACVTVLYMPQGEDEVRSMEVEIPFQCSKDSPQIREDCAVCADVCLCRADASELNPRKLLLRVSLSFRLRVYAKEVQAVSCDVLCSAKSGVEKQIAQHTTYHISDLAEKAFVFSEVLRQPAAKPQMEQLLCCQILPGTAQGRAIGKKLVCKGSFPLLVLYRGDGEVLGTGFELPFSLIIDLEQPRDEAQVELSVCVTALQCSLQEGELAVSVDALAQAAVWTQCALSVLQDAYGTQFPLDVSRRQLSLCPAAQWDSCRESARQFCESGIPARQVLCCTAAVEAVEERREEGRLCAAAQIRAQVLYCSEDSALCSVSCLLPLECEIPLPAECACLCRCDLVGEAAAVPVTGGLEVRCEAVFSWVTVRREETPCVSALSQGSAAPDQDPKPSVTVRVVKPGETLWDVAKSCCASLKDIEAVNDLSQGDPAPGALLLIPVKRSAAT